MSFVNEAPPLFQNTGSPASSPKCEMLKGNSTSAYGVMMPACTEASISEKPAARALPLGQPPSDVPGTAGESAVDASSSEGSGAGADGDVPLKAAGTKRRRLSVLADAAILAS